MTQFKPGDQVRSLHKKFQNKTSFTVLSILPYSGFIETDYFHGSGPNGGFTFAWHDLELIQPTQKQQKQKSITVYKKAKYCCNKNKQANCIITLTVPPSAKRNINSDKYSIEDRKCRSSSAKVVEIRSIATGRKLKKAFSSHDNTFIYRVGKTVKPRGGYEESLAICAPGIHWFLNKTDARDYEL